MKMDENELIIEEKLNLIYNKVRKDCIKKNEEMDIDRFCELFYRYIKDNYPDIDENYNIDSYLQAYLTEKEKDNYTFDD